MTSEEIWRIIVDSMAEEFELESAKMTREARIKDDLGLDSLDVVDMVVVLETAFDFKIQDKTALAKIETLGDVAGFIESIVEAEQKAAS